MPEPHDVAPILTRDDLLALGWSPRRITAAVRSGDLLRLRRAWYASPAVPLEQRIAIAWGGRVGAVSAARSYGMWTGLDRDIHVSWDPHGNVARPGRRGHYPFVKELTGRTIVPHWRSGRLGKRTWRESPLEAIRQTFLSLDRGLAIAMADSGCRLGLVTAPDVRRALRGLPSRVDVPPGAIDGAPDSGLECLVRFRLLESGIPFVHHAKVHGLEVDFLLGSSLVVETDGREFHTGAAFEVDRARDLLLGTAGYLVIRLSYRMVVQDWATCARRILAALERGDHLRPTT